MKSSNFLGIGIFILIAGGFIYLLSSGKSPQPTSPTQAVVPAASNPTTDVKANTQVQATTVQVARFYNGQDGYSLSIPSGNTSTCIWTWAGGSADVPYSQTTTANSATEKHTITFPDGSLDSLYSFKVNCTDDFGNQYTGIFPTK